MFMKPETRAKLRESRRVKLLIVFVTILLIVMMFPRGESIESEVNVGSIWIQDDLIASTTFEILKNPTEYEKEKQQAASKVQPVFIRDNNINSASIDSMRNYNSLITGLISNSLRLGIIPQRPQFISDQSFTTIFKIYKEPRTLKDLKIRSLSEVFRLTTNLLNSIYQRGLLNVSYMEIGHDSIAVRDGRFEKITPKTNYFDRITVDEYIGQNLQNLLGDNRDVVDALTEYLLHFLKPNMIYNKALTDEAIQNAKDEKCTIDFSTRPG